MHDALVTLGVGSSGRVGAGSSIADAVLDVVSHVLTSGGSAYTAVTPNQLVDTRVTGTPFNNGQVRSLAIAGKAGAPADATAVVLSATGRGAGSRGLLSVFP